MARRFWTNTIGLHLRDRINAIYAADIGSGVLKRCMLGDLRAFAARQDFMTKIPALYIVRELVTPNLLSLDQQYEVSYTYRIVYLDTIKTALTDADDTHEDNVVNRLETVADALAENIVLALPTPIVLPNGQVNRVEIGNIDFNPPESELVRSFHADAYAATLGCRVVTQMWATP